MRETVVVGGGAGDCRGPSRLAGGDGHGGGGRRLRLVSVKEEEKWRRRGERGDSGLL